VAAGHAIITRSRGDTDVSEQIQGGLHENSEWERRRFLLARQALRNIQACFDVSADPFESVRNTSGFEGIRLFL